MTKKIRAAVAANDSSDGAAPSAPKTPKTPKRTAGTNKTKSAPKRVPKTPPGKSEPDVDDDDNNDLLLAVLGGPRATTPTPAPLKKTNNDQSRVSSQTNDDQVQTTAATPNYTSGADSSTPKAPKKPGRKRKVLAAEEPAQGIEPPVIGSNLDQPPSKKKLKSAPINMSVSHVSDLESTQGNDFGDAEPVATGSKPVATGSKPEKHDDGDHSMDHNQVTGAQPKAIEWSFAGVTAEDAATAHLGRAKGDSAGIQCLLDAAHAAREDSVV